MGEHKQNKAQIKCFSTKMPKRILNIHYWDHIRNETVLEMTGQRKMDELMSERRLRFLGHLMRIPESRYAKIAVNWKPCHGKRKRGRPRLTWRSTISNDLQARNISWEEAMTLASDRNEWRKVAALCSVQNERN